MADYAILTGISWYPNPGFSQLQGPPNDVALVKDWLIAKGGVPAANIKEILSPPVPPADIDPDLAPPIPEQFDVEFKRLLRARMAMGAARSQSDRLYLFFSGHGFCSNTQNKDAEAALYCANATREMYEHIFGTQYARIAKQWALFSEVVLIMDVCRDAEIARTPIPKPYRDTPDDGLAADVKLMSLYAVPKGGKAQEREIPERGNRVHGLLTHALIKMLDELPVAAQGLSSSDLRQNLLESWNSICGDTSTVKPEVYLPGTGDIYFAAGAQGSPFEFRFQAVPTPTTTLSVFDHTFQQVAQFDFAAGAPAAVPGNIVAAQAWTAPVLKLRMRQGFYQFRLTDTAQPMAAPIEAFFKVDGGDQYVQL